MPPNVDPGESLLEPLLVDLGNVRALVVLMEERAKFETPDLQTRVSLEVMRRRLDAIIETSRAYLNEPTGVVIEGPHFQTRRKQCGANSSESPTLSTS